MLREQLLDRDEGDLFVFLVAGDALGFGVECRFAIDQELVVMVAMAELNLDGPRAVGLAFHGCGAGIPVVEVAHERRDFCLWSKADEINRLEGFLRC